MAYYVLFDTETTGNQEEDRVIQFGAMIVDQKGKVEAFDEFCSSDVEIKLEAMEVHNITPNLLIGKPKATETSFYKRLEELNSNENFLIAHNISFDMGMIKKEGFVNQYQIIDTLRCAKHLFPELPYHRLQYIRYALELYKVEEIEASKHNITIKAHDAIGDVLVMKLFLTKLVGRCREIYPDYNPIEKLVDLTKTPVFIKTFKFGKYKGKDVEEVAKIDTNYLNWMRTSMELDEDLKYTLDKVLKS
ncbi:MAG: exonuclease domain-containing protein [Arcobacter sp.]|jgi:DNA polymerase-3 subunit epsilon/exodeoxyribonuclease X|uniref:DEDDh 3'-5' exonuclease domain family protein n=1 Tax=Arcobacter defluvii TaxID=873191 RepID=A0AAE7E694_9BACT|nr:MULTISPECIES: 3'-5' exonuclease [Arcobacter]MDY3201680.1 3'-5' exonuclease [Arcobacter sp.]QKF77660.1 DEDDh 3'-5' exonuclease domain family protein [Arcobacter defluvii]RXI34368.1 DNA polymerase III subunit epsilon [Arcobacter defluvii]